MNRTNSGNLENIYTAIFNSSVEAILLADQTGSIVLINPRGEALFGYDSGELYGVKVEKLIPNRFHEKHKDYRIFYDKTPIERPMGIGKDIVGLKKDGSEFPAEVSLSPIIIDNHQKVIVFIIDISARKKIEASLVESEEQSVKYTVRLERKNIELQRQREFLKSINNFSSLLLGKTNLNEIAWIITEQLISKYEFEDCVIYAIRDKYCYQISAFGPKDTGEKAIFDPIRIKIGDGIVGHVALTGKPEIVNDTSLDDRYIADDQIRYSELTVPIISDGKVIGIIDSEHSKKSFYNDDHLKTITTISNLITVLFKNSLMEEINRDLERKIEVRNQTLISLINNLPEGILLNDDNGSILITNNEFRKIFEMNVSAEEIVGLDQRQSAELVKHMFQNPDEFIEVVNYCLKHNNQIISRKLTMKNGKILECNFIPIIAHSNQSIGQLWKVQDVTSRHLAQRKISESEEKYRGIIENMELALMEVDNNHKILKVYDRFCDMIGYTESELIDKNARDVFLPPDYEKVIHEQDQLRADGKRSVFEMQMRKKDGDLIWVLIGGSPIFDQNGKTVGSIGIHYDITDRKKLEEELEEARIQAEKARMAEQQFLANMSHEIRNPLNSIIGISNLLYDTNPTLEQLKHLDNVKRSSDILLGLISGILDISQIESGNLVLVEKEIDIADIVSGLIQIVSFNAKEKNIKFESNLFEKKNFRVVADPTVINQIFLNLLNNAIKFTKQGSIKVDGQFVEDIENKCRYQFTVSDTGIGIPKEDILTIFESFKQAGKNTKLKYGGTGLGLSIVKKLVSLYQGTINVESTVNKGTTFKFDLKLQKSKSPSAKKIKLEFTSTGNSHLLIVEDNKINQQYLSGILNKWNIQSHYANNGLEALDYLDKNQYSLILMDIRMPEMDGYETTIRLRSDHFNVNKDVPIIALTASALVDEREKALSTGMNYHLTKPFTPDDLAYALANFGIITEKNAPNNLEFVFSDDLDGKYLLEFYQKDIERASVMFELFLKVIDDEFEKLRSLLKTKSWNEFSSQVHKIKPNFNIVGLTELAKIMKEYEGARDQSNIRNKVESTFSKTEEKLSEGKSHVKNELVRMQKFQKS